MWLLRNDEKGLIYRVTAGKQHVVSRKDGDLLLVGDQSISRKHALFYIDNENEDNGVIVKDLESKYGTFTIIGDEEQSQLSTNQEVTLKCGDTVKFGIQWNFWRVEFVPLLVATSTLTQQEKADVKQMVVDLGGQVLSDWQDVCTHLTMNKLTVTVKVVCALASGQPIVTPAYWKSFKEALCSMQSTLPDCKDFLPPLAEAVLNPSEVSFSPNPARSKLFNGLTFVAATAKQLSRIKPMVTAAGGNVVQFYAIAWPEEKIAQDNVILMLHSANEKQGSQQSQMPDGYIPIARKLRALQIRCVPESEIGLSILYCSLEQYCNPRYNARSLIGSSSLQSTQPVTVVCPDSEGSSIMDNKSDEPNSEESVQPVSKKRAHTELMDKEEENPANKKTNTRENSEDIFGSQDLNATGVSKNSSKMSLSLKKNMSPPSVPKEKVSLRHPSQSLDMFAPSASGEKNKCPNAPVSSCVIEKPSDVQNMNDVRPSCEDFFASTGNTRHQQNQRVDNNDVFAFAKNKNSMKPKEKSLEDEFSFAKKRINKPNKRIADKEDEFSFVSKRKTSNAQGNVNEGDEFSFASDRMSRKRNRQSNPDMFESTVEPSTSSAAKVIKTESDMFSTSGGKRDVENNNLFAFPVGHKTKRKRLNDSILNSDDTGSEVKIALFSKENESLPTTVEVEQESRQTERLQETKNLVTYSKNIPAPVKVKQEIEDEEINELAKELHNTTIVIVKPLVVARPKPAETSSKYTGKNFKKFRKVTSVNKRLVPHIIGGSDLVPHNKVCDFSDDDLIPPASPPHESPNDEWGFQKNKRKGKAN